MRSTQSGPHEDEDEAVIEVGRAARAVGLQLMLTAAVLTALVLAAILIFVLLRLDPGPDPTADVAAADILLAGSAIGIAVIAAAGLFSWLATRRAVRPLAETLSVQRAFVENAGHELRTPLAVLDARLQYLQMHLAIGDPSADTVARLRVDTAVLTQIVGDMLETVEHPFTRSDSPTPIDPVLRLAVDSIRLLAADRSITIDCVGDTGLASSMHSGDLHRCLIAVLDNAVRFSPDRSTVTVTAETRGGAVLIAVRDQGPGITGIAVEDVFRRFARGTGGAPRTGGAGIGLALVQDVVRAAGGAVEVTQSGPEGTCVVMRLPAASASIHEDAQP